jgi:NDP-sugar pyrophosphorylase family protein
MIHTSAQPAITKAMILAAGLGTRFKPWTDRHPKALAVVNGKSLLQRNIEYLQTYGIRDVVVNVHHFAGQIIEALAASKGWGSRYIISDETQEVLETGGGLQKARPFLNEGPFVLMNVDILTDLDLSALMNDFLEHRPLATLAVTNRPTSRYFLFDRDDKLCGWQNVQTGQVRMADPEAAGTEGLVIGQAPPGTVQKAFSGIHVIDAAIFPLIGRQGKYSMVDVYLDLAGRQTIRGFDHSRGKLIDVGKPESVGKAESLFP